jgi:hypothetical protein
MVLPDMRMAPAVRVEALGKRDVPEGGGGDRDCSRSLREDLQRLRGLRTEQIREALGTAPCEEVIHRDNLVVSA